MPPKKTPTRRVTRARKTSQTMEEGTVDEGEGAQSGSVLKKKAKNPLNKKARTMRMSKDVSNMQTVDEGNLTHTSLMQQVVEEPKKKDGKGGEVSKEAERAVDAFVDNVVRLGADGVRKQYDTLKTYEPSPRNIDAFKANPTKNRYLDVACLDDTRVKLNDGNDYIHANWVKRDDVRTYIATQGPLEETIEDFWTMCFQENASAVIMLCQTTEEGKAKCAQYWPIESGGYKTYGKMFVNNKKVECDEKFNIYTIELLPEGCSNSNIVKLFHLTSWPDRGTPLSARTVLRLLRTSSSVDKLASGPVVCHCSAGIGRTGTIIMIDWIQNALFHKAMTVDPVELFHLLRNQRLSSIQTDGQWLFVHTTIMDYVSIKMPKHSEAAKKFKADALALNLAA